MNAKSILNFSPPLSHRFGVFFFPGEVGRNPIDIRFQKVSGLDAEVETTTITEGGQNLYAHRLPTSIKYNNLVLERGLALVSPLTLEFNVTLSQFRFLPSNVIITLFDAIGVPLTGWLFMKAYPVRWSASSLDAEANAVSIETMELAYTRFQTIKL